MSSGVSSRPAATNQEPRPWQICHQGPGLEHTPLLLEHVNLNIPSALAGHAFYVGILGGALNPSGTRPWQLHVNLGASQFHLPFAATPPQGGELLTEAQVCCMCGRERCVRAFVSGRGMVYHSLAIVLSLPA